MPLPQANQLAELLEPRCLLAVTPLIVNNTNLLVQLESSDNVVIQSDASGNLEVLSNGSLVIATPTIAVNTLTSISVFGGDGPNRIDLTNVTTAAFDVNLTVTVNGGDGSDTILGSEFADSLIGGNGADSITGALADDTVEGSNGNDTLAGGAGNDSLFGGDGADSIHGDAGNDTVVAGNGADQVFGDAGLDSLNGGDGSDTLNGDADEDTLSGDNGNDSLLGGTENDVLSGGNENDIASGGDGDDTLTGGDGNDTLNGNDGADSLTGDLGNDSLSGGIGIDNLNGSTGNDTVDGGDDTDVLFGGSGNDSLLGGGGDDTVSGQAGNDTLTGGGGADSLDGGDGNDLVRSTLPSLFINDFTITEPDSGTATMTFTVMLSSVSTSTVTVDFATASGTATEASDFNRATGRLTFAPNVVSQTITVLVIGDTNIEPDETFVVNLTNAVNALVGDSQGLGTIADNDLVSSFGTPIVNVPGQGFTNVAPPDTSGDVGPNHYVQTINAGGGARVRVYDKSGNVLSNFVMDSLAAGGPAASGAGDGVALYDELADRWVLMEFSAAANGISIFVSQTPDPTNGLWFSYFFATARFPDYPKIAVWPDSYVLTTNEGTGPAMYAVDRTNMLIGAAARPIQRFTAPALAGFGFQALTPADFDGATPPAGNPSYFMRHRDDEAHNVGANNPNLDFLELWQLQVDFNNPANSNFSLDSTLPVAEFDSDLNGFFSFSAIVQPAPGPPLDPLREVIMHRLQYRNFGTYETLVGSFVTDTNAADHAGIRWFELRRIGGGAWNVFQDGLFNPDNTLNRWMSSIAMDAQGNIAIGYSVADATTFPSMRYAGRRAADPLNQITTGEFTIINGTGSHSNVRWGDYAAMSVDPADGRTFWFTSEYALANGTWSTQVASFAFPNVVSAGGSGFPSFVDVGDTLIGGNGNDTLNGADGNDSLNGMAGNDSLAGGAGNDTIQGGTGDDSLDGGLGDDTLDGQGGNDRIGGGDGSDTFVWNGAGDGVDTLSSLSGYDRVRVQGTSAANNYVVSQVSGLLQITDGTAVLNLSPIIQVVDIFAGAGNDRITINALDRVRTATILTVNGEDGNDKINSNGANLGFVRVSLIGGLGDDTLIGGSGIDSLDGGDGDDSLNAQGGNDLVFGGIGDDTIFAGTGNDRVFGGDGNDNIDAGAGDDSVVGEVGADTIAGQDGNDTLDGGDGTDTINGGSGNDSILGGNEADDLNGSTGNDTVRGGASDDTIIGENGNDSLFGDDGNDSILGFDGDDTLSGGDGDDTIDGMAGNDLVGGGNGDDLMNGAAGNDTLTGGDGNDTIAGGAGNDVLLGDEGDDSLNGQGNTDIINPGEGANTVLDPITEIDTTFVLSAALLAALA